MRYSRKEDINALRERFPVGSRIVLNHMTDPYHPVEPGTKGTLRFIDDMGTLHVIWDNGRTLGLIYGKDSFSILDPLVKQNQALSFIFSDEIYVSDDLRKLEGYLPASDTLVARLKQQLQQHLSPDELSSIDNINFYPVYDPQAKSVTLHSHFYTVSEAGEQGRGVVLALNAEESSLLISEFEAYCKSRYQESCTAFLNGMRTREGMPCLAKPSLTQQIGEIQADSANKEQPFPKEKQSPVPER